jgi:hypothetical protein
MLENRLISLRKMNNKYSLLSLKEVMQEIKQINCTIKENTNSITVTRLAKDIANDDRKEVLEWIHSLNLPLMDHVHAVWLAEREGIIIKLHNFLECYDDLWFPSSDDVLIFPLSVKWMLEFSHEEKLYYYYSDIK